jgi:GT2 family glycosyltransferase
LISASIVLFQSDAELLVRAIASVLANDRISKLVLVDNSPDRSLEAVVPRDRRVEYIHRPENLGFGRGHNLAFGRVDNSDYHIILNPDVYFDVSVISALEKYMHDHPEVGLVMPKVLFTDGRVQHRCKLLPTPTDLFMRRFLPASLRNIFKSRMAEYEMRDMSYDQEMRVPCLSGCFMFVRSSVMREVDGFDERFFLYMEDVDLSRRIGLKYHTMYYPKVHVYHLHAKGSYASNKLRNLHIQSALTYFRKWGWFNDREREELNSLRHLPPKPAAVPRQSARSIR